MSDEGWALIISAASAFAALASAGAAIASWKIAKALGRRSLTARLQRTDDERFMVLFVLNTGARTEILHHVGLSDGARRFERDFRTQPVAIERDAEQGIDVLVDHFIDAGWAIGECIAPSAVIELMTATGQKFHSAVGPHIALNPGYAALVVQGMRERAEAVQPDTEELSSG